MTIRGPLSSRLSNQSSGNSGGRKVGLEAIAGLAGGVATNVYAAFVDVIALLGNKADASALSAHQDDTSDAHDAAAISYAGASGMSATDLEAAIDELAAEKQSLSEKDQNSGYAGLNSSGRVPIVHLASGTPDGTKFIRDDGALAVPAGGGGGAVSVQNNDSTITGSATVIDFSSSFAVTDSPAGEANVAPTFGSSAGNFAQGNDARIPTQGENDALVGTTGTPSSTNKYVTNEDTRLLKYGQAVFYAAGDLTVKTGVGKHKIPSTGSSTIYEVTIEVDALPAGAALIADVNQINNTTNARTTLYGTQGNRPTISTAGPYSNVATLPNTVTLSAGTSISVDVDQIGSTGGSPGKDCVIIVRYTYT